MPAFHRLATNEYTSTAPSGRQSQAASPNTESASAATTRTQDATDNNATDHATNNATENANEAEYRELGDDQLSATETDARNDDTGGTDTDATTIRMQPDSRDLSPNHLGVITLTILVFYNVSGGPFGIEASVRSAGNRMALLGFLLGPLIFSFQEALLTAELGTTFPEAGAGVAWVEEAFGAKAGWICGYLGWISGATDNAIYPVLFLDYLREMLGQKNRDSSSASNLAAESDASASDESRITSFLLLAFSSAVLGYINWRGLAVVGQLSVWIAVIAMSPFVIMTVVGSFHVNPERWLEWPSTSQQQGSDESSSGVFHNIEWAPFVNNLFWNLNSFDSAGSFAGEIEAAKFHKAMLWSTLLVAICYFLPLLVAIGASPPSSQRRPGDWDDGYLAVVNSELVGPWLGAWTVMAAGISNIGLFQAELSADAFQLMGMADRGHVPKIFGRRSRYGTPTYGIILGLIVILLMDFVSDLDQLIEMLNFNYAVSLLMEYAAFFQLRIRHPEIERPYRIPLGTVGCLIFFAPSLLGTILVLSLAGKATYIMFLSVMTVGFLMVSLWQNEDVRNRYGPNLPVSNPEIDALTDSDEISGIASD